MKQTNSASLRRLARAGAIMLAVTVVAYLVWRAQSNTLSNTLSNTPSNTQSNTPPGDPTTTDAMDVANLPVHPSTADEANIVVLPASLSSSKSLAPDALLLPSSKQASPDTLVPAWESMPALPQKKSPSRDDVDLVFSSKLGPPIKPSPKLQSDRKPNQPNQPNQN